MRRLCLWSTLGLLAACDSSIQGGALPDAGQADASHLLDANVAVDSGSQFPPGATVLYLQGQGGVTYRPAADSNSATNESIVLSQTVTPSAAPFDSTQWSSLLACVRATLSPYNIVVTDSDPGSREHTEVVVTNDVPETLGFNAGSRYAVAAACGYRDTVIFIYPAFHQADLPETVEHMCQGVVYALGYTIGLHWVYQWPDRSQTDVMNANYHDSAWKLSCDAPPAVFRDLDLPCGYENGFDFGTCDATLRYPEDCRCGGTSQNSHARMLQAFGAAVSP